MGLELGLGISNTFRRETPETETPILTQILTPGYENTTQTVISPEPLKVNTSSLDHNVVMVVIRIQGHSNFDRF